MKLLYIRIRNHTRLQDADVAVREHLVLVGSNDVGKSSLLRCLDLVLGSSTAQLYTRVTPDDVRDHTAPFTVEVLLGDLTLDEEAEFPDEVHVSQVDGSKTLAIRLEVTAVDDDTVQIQRTAPNGRSGRQVSRAQLARLAWRMIGAMQAGARDFRSDRNSSLDDILSSIDLGDERADFAAIAAQFQERLSDSEALAQLRKQLAAQLSRAIPEQLDAGDLSFISGVSATQDVLSDVRLQVQRHGEPRNMTQQSDGTRALFAIALYDLVSESANMVAIDEPEIHLHPTSQRSLARLLRDGGNQKIIATHSPDIVGSFRPEQIVAVRPGGRLVQPKADFLTDDQRLMAHWWVRNKLEPLTAARVVLVEGASDRIIVECCAELLRCDLDRLGTSVVELDGSGDVGYVLSLFGAGGFQIPLSFLIDEDAVSKTAKKLEVGAAELPARGVYVCKRDLEEEYARAVGGPRLWKILVDSGLFSTNELGNCTVTGADGTRTEDDVAGFCRKKKVKAAIALANALDAQAAERMAPIVELLASVTAGTR